MASVGEMRAVLLKAVEQLRYAAANVDQGPMEMSSRVSDLAVQIKEKVEEGMAFPMTVAMSTYLDAKSLLPVCHEQGQQIFAFMEAIQQQMEEGYRQLSVAAGMSSAASISSAMREVSVANDAQQVSNGALVVLSGATENLPQVPHPMVPEHAENIRNRAAEINEKSGEVVTALSLAADYIDTYQATL